MTQKFSNVLPEELPASTSVVLGTRRTEHSIEPLITIREAAEALGLHYWQLQRAVARGGVPSYTAFNSRRRVYLSEIQACIEASRIGGGA